MPDKYSRMKALVKIALAVVVGLVLGGALWHFVPKGMLVDQDSLYLVALGTAFDRHKNGDLKGAEETLQSAIRKWPARYEAYMYLGDFLLERGDTNGALSNYVMAVRYCGTSPTNFAPMEIQLRERARISEQIQKLQR